MINGIQQCFTPEEYIIFQKFMYDQYKTFCFANVWLLADFSKAFFTILDSPFGPNRPCIVVTPNIKNCDSGVIGIYDFSQQEKAEKSFDEDKDPLDDLPF